MGLFGGISRLFRKGASKAGSLFKKGVRGIGSIARKGFYEGVEQLPLAGQVAGGALGSTLGEAGAIAIGQPELAPEFGVAGGLIGGRFGKMAGEDLRGEIKKPISRGRLGADPRTYTPQKFTPSTPIPKAVKVKPQVRNELERKKAMKMNELITFL